jgi:uncharacterized protein with NRDE domain
MCTLAIYFRMFGDYPVVVAANRDEFLERPALPPTALGDRPRIIGGQDLRAKGTWLGINEHGLIVGLLNRRFAETRPTADKFLLNQHIAETRPNDDKLRSRGLLCLDALQHTSAASALQYVERQRARDYNGFNLLMASRKEAFVAYNRGGEIEVVKLTPGMHLLTNADVDDFECPRISRSYSRFAELGQREDFAADPVGRRAELAALLADHSTQLDARTGRPNSLCLHLGDYGTRSSSLIFMRRESTTVNHFFASGPPCTTSYERAAVP